jgi:hypothetical protein
MTGEAPRPAAPAPPAAQAAPPGPMPKRLYLAAGLLLILAGLMGVLALIGSYASSLGPAPLGLLGLAGPAALAALLDVELVAVRSRWATFVTAIVVGVGVLGGLAASSSPFGIALLLVSLISAALVFSVSDAFPDAGSVPEGLWSPRTWIPGIAIVGVIVWNLVASDPLRPGDVRDVEWAGVVASATDDRLIDGRTMGTPTERFDSFSDGDLAVGGGTVEAPTWVTRFPPHDGEPTCYEARRMGYDDGTAVVIVIHPARGRVGLRVAKAAGFTNDGVTDGRYVGAGPGDRSVAMVGGDPLTPAPVGYFCLDAEGHATRWDRGYGP